MKKRNKVKAHHLSFSLSSDGSTERVFAIGFVTFDDDTCKAIKVISDGVMAAYYMIGNQEFNCITDVYRFISGECPDITYEEIEVEEEKTLTSKK